MERSARRGNFLRATKENVIGTKFGKNKLWNTI